MIQHVEGQEPLGAEVAVVRELVAVRSAWLRSRGADPAQLAPVLEHMRDAAPREFATLQAWAATCELDAHALLVLDGGLLDTIYGVGPGSGLEGALGFYVDGPRGPVLGGAWALAPAEAEQVDLRELHAPDMDGPAHVLGLPGSLGMAAISSSGFAVLALQLRPRAAGTGVPGSALLRRISRAPRQALAREAIETTGLIDGRCWMLADGRSFLGFEQLADERILTRVGAKTGHVHANHCFDPSLRQREALPRSAASFRRLELASTLYVQRRPDTAEAVLAFFDAVELAAFPAGTGGTGGTGGPGERAETLFAVELNTGRAWLRRRAGQTPALYRFHTPLCDDLEPGDSP